MRRLDGPGTDQDSACPTTDSVTVNQAGNASFPQEKLRKPDGFMFSDYGLMDCIMPRETS
jgi:hypothetical protein